MTSFTTHSIYCFFFNYTFFRLTFQNNLIRPYAWDDSFTSSNQNDVSLTTSNNERDDLKPSSSSLTDSIKDIKESIKEHGKDAKDKMLNITSTMSSTISTKKNKEKYLR